MVAFDAAERLAQALQWHAQGQFTKAWSLYERLAPTQYQSPFYWLALTLLSLQKGESTSVQCFERFQALSRASYDPWDYWHRLPFALWAQALGHWRGFAPEALQTMNTNRPAEGIHPYFDFLLTLLLAPRAKAISAAKALLTQAQSTSSTEGWVALAQAEALCYLRHQHMHADPTALAPQITLLQQEIAVQIQAVLKANALDLLGRLLLVQGDLATARSAFAEAVHCDPTALRQLQHALCHLPLPLLTPQVSVESIYQQLLQFLHTKAPPIPITQIVTQASHGVFTLFDWNYEHPQDHLLRRLHGDRFSSVVLVDQGQIPSVPASGGLGIVVTPGQEGMFYFSNQTLLGPLSQQIPVHLLVFAPHAIWYTLKQQIPQLQIHFLSGAFGNSHDGARFIKQWDAVRQWGLQWIYYWEVGTDTLSFLIPYFCLAPVQFTSWGSVSSTGHPAIDYFLTTALLSPLGPDTAACFREHCVYLPQLPVGFVSAALLNPIPLPDDGICRVGCLHTPRKNSPQFLAALQAVLSRHQQNHPELAIEVIMVESTNALWQKAFALAVEQALGQYAACVTWLPRQDPDAFIGHMQRMDLLLDAFPFGGGKLVYDSLLCGIPMVSLRGSQLRGRIPFAFYTELDIYDARFTAVTDVESYIVQACALIHQPALREVIRQRILQGRERLVRRQLSEDFLQALQTMTQSQLSF